MVNTPTHTKSIWNWDSSEIAHPESLIEMCKTLGCDAIYEHFETESIVSTNETIKNFITTCHNNNIDVYAIFGDSTYYNAYEEKMKPRIDTFANYNAGVAAIEKLDGIIWDVEPHADKSSNLTTDEKVQLWVETAKIAYQYANSLNIRVIYCNPVWYKRAYIESFTTYSDGISYMNYAKSTMMKSLNDEIEIAKTQNKWIENITEFNKGSSIGDNDDSCFEMGLNNGERLWKLLKEKYETKPDSFSYHYYKPIKLFLIDKYEKGGSETMATLYPEVEWGSIDRHTGLNEDATDCVRTTGFIPVVPNTAYLVYNNAPTAKSNRCTFYDENKDFVTGWNGQYNYQNVATGGTVTAPSEAKYIRIRVLDQTELISIWIEGVFDGDEDLSFPLDLFKPFKVSSTKLDDLKIRKGQFIITTDTNEIFVDVDNKTRKGYTKAPYGIEDLSALNLIQKGENMGGWLTSDDISNYIGGVTGFNNLFNAINEGRQVVITSGGKKWMDCFNAVTYSSEDGNFKQVNLSFIAPGTPDSFCNLVVSYDLTTSSFGSNGSSGGIVIDNASDPWSLEGVGIVSDVEQPRKDNILYFVCSAYNTIDTNWNYTINDADLITKNFSMSLFPNAVNNPSVGKGVGIAMTTAGSPQNAIVPIEYPKMESDMSFSIDYDGDDLPNLYVTSVFEIRRSADTSLVWYVSKEMSDGVERYTLHKLEPLMEGDSKTWDFTHMDGYSCSFTTTAGLGKACLEENTLIKTKNGGKAIKDLNVGDRVIDKDGNETKITKIVNHTTQNLYVLSTDKKEKICSTALHRFNTDHGIIPMSNLVKDIMLNKVDGTQSKVLGYTIIRKPIKVYEIQTETNNYVLNNDIICECEEI